MMMHDDGQVTHLASVTERPTIQRHHLFSKVQSRRLISPR
jgi:hypothetical protein